MFRFVAVLLFFLHLGLLHIGGLWRWTMPIIIGLPALVLLGLNILIGTEENHDVLWILPWFAMLPLAAAEILFLGLNLYARFKSKN